MIPLWLSFVLLGIGLLAVIIELFVPAGGLIGIAGGAAVITGIVLAFVHHSTTDGTIVLFTAIFTTPIIIGIALKIFPRTFVGKRLILVENQMPEEGYTSYTPQNYEHLVGKTGSAYTALRPSGMVIIEDRKYSVVTPGNFIDKNKSIRVLRTEGSRIVVSEIKNKE